MFLPLCLFGNDYKKYLLYTNYAELSIVKNDYKLAERYYDTAFNFWDKPFAVDIYNDLRCANINTDYVTVAMLAKRLILLGCPSSFFYESEYLSDFRKSLAYYSLINAYEANRLKFIKKTNWALRAKIEALRLKDQVLRNQDHNYTYLKDSIYKVDDTIKTELQKIFKHGFPNEYDYGVFLKDDTTLMEFEPLHLIILHNYGKFDTAVLKGANIKTIDFTPFLLGAVNKGKMHPQEFAYLNDRSGKFMLGKGYWQCDGFLVEINGKMYYNNVRQKEKIEIDKNRQSLGLDTYDEEKKKTLFMVRHKNKFIFFKHMGYIVRMNDPQIPEKVFKIAYKEADITED